MGPHSPTSISKGTMVYVTSEPGSTPAGVDRPTAGRALGLPQSTALIMGSIIGVGIF